MIVKVWNDNVHPYREKFREKQIDIPAKGFIEMPYDEALSFARTWSPPRKDADENDIPEGYKMIRIEKPAYVAPTKPVDPLLCQSCRYLATDQKDLGAHLKGHDADILVDEEAEAVLRAKQARKPKAG